MMDMEENQYTDWGDRFDKWYYKQTASASLTYDKNLSTQAKLKIIASVAFKEGYKGALKSCGLYEYKYWRPVRKKTYKHSNRR